MNKKVAWGLGIGAVLVTGIGVAVYIKVKKNKQDKLDAAALQNAKQQETQFERTNTGIRLTPKNSFKSGATNQLDLQNIMSGLRKPQAPIRTSEPDSDYTTSGWDYEKDMPIFSKAPIRTSEPDSDYTTSGWDYEKDMPIFSTQSYYRNPDDNDY